VNFSRPYAIEQENHGNLKTGSLQDFRRQSGPENRNFFSKEVALRLRWRCARHFRQRARHVKCYQEAGSGFIGRVIVRHEALVMSFDSNVDLLSISRTSAANWSAPFERADQRAGSGERVGNPGPIGSRQITGTALYDADLPGVQRKTRFGSRAQSNCPLTDAQGRGSKVKLEKRSSGPAHWIP